MDVDAGEHGTLSSPDHLIDPGSGEVLLRLLRQHLERLHAPKQRGSYVPCGGDPQSPYAFPLLKGTLPIDVTLRGGMTPRQVSSGVEFELAGDLEGRSWWRWIAYALTPFGWVFDPTPQFRDTRRIARRRTARLQDLTLAPSCLPPDAAFAQAEAWLEHELGPPHDASLGPAPKQRRAWTYDWGEVRLWHELRDGAAEVVISWS